MTAPVLPRMRRNLECGLIAGSRPYIPPLPQPFSVRAAVPEDDAQLVSDWMNRRHLVDTWEQDWPAQRWRADMASRIAGEYSLPCIIGYDNRDVGYLELYWVAQDEVGAMYDCRAHDTGLHIAIGEQDLLGKGIFSRFLKALSGAVLEADPKCELVVADPDHRNGPMRRALAKAGFTESLVAPVRPGRTIALATRGRAITPESIVSEVLS